RQVLADVAAAVPVGVDLRRVVKRGAIVGGIGDPVRITVGQRRRRRRREREIGGDGEVAGGIAGADAVVVRGASGQAGEDARVGGHERAVERGETAVGGGRAVLDLGVGRLVGGPGDGGAGRGEAGRVGGGDGRRRQVVRDGHGDGGRGGDIPRGVAGGGDQGVGAVGGGRGVPGERIGRRGVLGAQAGAVQLELHAGHADVVARGCCDRDGAGDGRSGGRSADGDRRRRGVGRPAHEQLRGDLD